MRTDPPGTIGVISAELSRYTDFSVSLMHVQAPVGTVSVWAKGTDVVGGMNTLVREMRGEWLWILGDDHVFQPDLLARLLEHRVDVVVPHVFKRTPPFGPVVFSHQNEDGDYVSILDPPEDELIEVWAAGSAGMLVRRRVLDAIDDPVFESHGGLNEDLTFCAKVREAGFSIHCDTGAAMGHINLFTVWPKFHDGEWLTAIDLGNGLILPWIRPREKALA